jgi:hypothetical protein
LVLSNTKITDAGLAHLKDLNLGTLNLSYTNTSDAGLKHLKTLTQLFSLDLKGTKITDAGLEYLKGLDNLYELDILETEVTDEGIKMLLRELPKCRVRWSPGGTGNRGTPARNPLGFKP